jgi:hypothetical protein
MPKNRAHLVSTALFVAVAAGIGTVVLVAEATPVAPGTPIAPAKPVPAPAPAPDPSGVKLDGDVVWSAVSGDTGEKSAVLDQSNDFQALWGVQWWEDGDDPCKFSAFGRHLNQKDNTKVATTAFCNGSPGNDKTIERRGDNEYITAIQACTTDKSNAQKDKIKGFRAWGRIVDTKTAGIGSENGPSEVTHTNCKTWKSKVSCPAGMIASKIKVYSERYNGESGPGVAKGVALGCRRLVRK